MERSWFSSNNFTAWRLGTLGQYISFILVVLAGILIFVLVIRRMNKQRTPEMAARRVAKRLKRLGGSGAKVYRNVVIPSADGGVPCEMLFMAKDKLHPVKVLYRGSFITGSVTDARWRLLDKRKEVFITNPVPALRQQAKAIEALMAEKGVADVQTEPLVVCAENYESPRVTISGFAAAVPYQHLVLWRKKHPIVKAWAMDTKQMDRILTEALIPAEAKDANKTSDQSK